LVIYDNPTPNFCEIFNNLCDEFGLEKDEWDINFDYINDGNYTLGYDKPGTCIRYFVLIETTQITINFDIQKHSQHNGNFVPLMQMQTNRFV